MFFDPSDSVPGAQYRAGDGNTDAVCQGIRMDWRIWIWIFGFLAVLFNPFFPIYLNRDLWSVIDLATGLFLVASVFVLKFGHKS